MSDVAQASANEIKENDDNKNTSNLEEKKPDDPLLNDFYSEVNKTKILN